MQRGKTGGNRRFLGTYTAMFALILAFILAYFHLANKTFLCQPDGIREHAPALAYIGRWIRDGLSGKGWRMVDFTLGQGLDVPTTLMWFCFSDPVAWISALFSESSVELVYALVLFLRIYLGGVFAALLALEFDADGWQASLAGILYAFSSYTFLAVMKHMNFGAGMMFLPLMLFAIERVFRKGRSGLYIFVAAVQLIANFYFAYKNTILAIVYIVLRLILELHEGRKVCDCAKTGLKLLGGYILGAMLSAVLLLPMIMAFLDSTRTDAAAGYRGSLLHYPMSYYLKLLLTGFQSPQNVSYWVIGGAIPLCAFGMTGLYLGRKKRAAVKIMPVIVLMMLSVPLIGKIMNGLGYVTNRYTYAIQLFIALGTVLGIEELEKLPPRGRRWVAAAWMVYACIGLAVLRHSGSLATLAIFAATAAFLFALPHIRKRFSASWARTAISLVTVGSICVSFVLAFGADPEHFIRMFLSPGDADYVQTSPMSVFSHSDEDDFYRVTSSNNLMEWEDGNYIGVPAALGGINGVAYYWSIIPSAVVDCHTDLYLNAQMLSFCVRNLGMDAQLNLLASVRYDLESTEGQDIRMAGYAEGDYTAKDGFKVLEDRYALPIGYTYDHAMSCRDYEALDAMEKRDALLRAAVLEEDTTGLPAPEETALQRLDVRLSGRQGTEEPLYAGETLEINCDVPGEGEVWLLFEAARANVSSDTQVILTVCGAEGRNTMAVINPKSNFAFPQKGQIVPMGVCSAGKKSFAVEIDNAPEGMADFICDDIRVYYRPLDAYEKAAKALGEDVLENVEMSANRVRGTIHLDEAKWLQLSIPYSVGWTAKVDGALVPLSKSGGMYMGLMLEPGDHEVVLSYTTPYLKEGAMISAAGAVICAALAIAIGRRKRAV